MVYTEKEKAWRIEYRKRPETKAKQKSYMKKYNSKPEVRQKRKEYLREYMKDYWKNKKDKYEEHKKRTAIGNKEREKIKEQIIQNVI